MYLLRLEKFDYDKMMFRREEYTPLSTLFDDCVPDSTIVDAETRDYYKYKLKNLAEEYHDVFINKEEMGSWKTLLGITEDKINLMYRPRTGKDIKFKILKV